MKSSNLAECLEESEFAIVVVDAPEENGPRMMAIENRGRPRHTPSRRSFDTRRIQIRDTGLPHFRVF